MKCPKHNIEMEEEYKGTFFLGGGDIKKEYYCYECYKEDISDYKWNISRIFLQRRMRGV